VLLPCLSLRDASCLRVTCRELREAVAEAPWADEKTRVLRPEAFFSCFPRARAVNLSARTMRMPHGQRGYAIDDAEALRVCDRDLALAAACSVVNVQGQIGLSPAGLSSLLAVRKLTLGSEGYGAEMPDESMRLTNASLRHVILWIPRHGNVAVNTFECMGRLETLELHANGRRLPAAAFGYLHSLTALKVVGAGLSDEALGVLAAAAPGKLLSLDAATSTISDVGLLACTGVTSLSVHRASKAGLVSAGGCACASLYDGPPNRSSPFFPPSFPLHPLGAPHQHPARADAGRLARRRCHPLYRRRDAGEAACAGWPRCCVQ
jgi:hypothetical protein